MKKFSFLMTIVFSIYGYGQNDTLTYSNEIEAADHIFELLDSTIYGPSLLNRAFNSGEVIQKQMQGKYTNEVMTVYDWAEVFDATSLSYTNHNLIPKIDTFRAFIYDYFSELDYTYDELVQPFSLILNHTAYIDTNLLQNESYFENDNGRLKPLVDENNIYEYTTLKAAALLEFYPDNGYETGKLIYDPHFIISSEDIEIISLQIDLSDGNGYQDFDENNNLLEYERFTDSTIAYAKVVYTLNNQKEVEEIPFYLTTQSNISTTKTLFSNWDDTYTFNSSGLFNLKVGVKYGCGNDEKIRRPFIIVPPYRPSIQKKTLNSYWTQFNIDDLFTKLTEMGYDVIFIKEKNGHSSISEGGEVIAEFITHINNEKASNYPDEDWENIVMGFSAGGQQARYALMQLEYEHMENNGPHHHSRLYIPFDSPQNGANVPLFTQSVYYEFSSTTVADMAYESLTDDASLDMLMNHIVNSISSDDGENIIIEPQASQNRDVLMNMLNNGFNHYYSHTNDLRKSYPTFTRNVAVSVGSYSSNYTSEFGLTEGQLLFKQNFYAPLGGFFVHKRRKIYASKYNDTDPENVFTRDDRWYILPTFALLSFKIQHNYKAINAYEWDLAQGGYKTEFYQGVGTGASFILRSSALFFGTSYYDGEVSFMPTLSALGINPSIWANNNLNYNLQNEDLFRIEYDPIIGNYSTTDRYGYPHLGYSTNHFYITPFEAVFADPYTYDHIKLEESANEYNYDLSYLGHLRNFILNEVEADTVCLQNQIIGNNHQLNDPNYTYKAWYKAAYEIHIGEDVTPKTDPNPYQIKNSGDITVYAGEAVHIYPGFSTDNGSQFHAYINPNACYLSNRSLLSNSSSNSENYTASDKQMDSTKFTTFTNEYFSLYPNPNHGQFTLEFNHSQLKEGEVSIYNVNGRLCYKQQVNERIIRMNTNLPPGTYLLIWSNSQVYVPLKFIVL